MPVIKHVVKQGESLSFIEKQYGFNQFDTIYKDASNDAFRSKRSNPEEIFPGDELYIPEKEIKLENIATETDNVIIIKKDKRFINLEISEFFDRGEPLANIPYTLIIGDKIHRGNLDSDGKLSVEISTQDKQANLSFEIKDQAGTSVYNWTLDIAHLDPIETPSGIAQRLENMGCMDVDTDKFYFEKEKTANFHQLTITWNAFAHSLCESMNWHNLEDGEQFKLTQEQFMVNRKNKDDIKTTNKAAQDLLRKLGSN